MEVEVSGPLDPGRVARLDMVIRTLRHGDTVVVEQPAYANLLQMPWLAACAWCRCRAMPTDWIARRWSAWRPSTGRAPCSSSYGAAESVRRQHWHGQRLRILQTAERHGLWVVEDDISRELAPGVTPMLAALDGGCRVVYLGGYSKVISRRCGWAMWWRTATWCATSRTKMAWA